MQYIDEISESPAKMFKLVMGLSFILLGVLNRKYHLDHVQNFLLVSSAIALSSTAATAVSEDVNVCANEYYVANSAMLFFLWANIPWHAHRLVDPEGDPAAEGGSQIFAWMVLPMAIWHLCLFMTEIGKCATEYFSQPSEPQASLSPFLS